LAIENGADFAYNFKNFPSNSIKELTQGLGVDILQEIEMH
jgi:hypothetical protein